MSREIQEIHISWGDYSHRYRVGETFTDPFADMQWGKITKIKYNQYFSLEHEKLTYDIYALDVSGAEPQEAVCKRIIGLPIELTYNTSK